MKRFLSLSAALIVCSLTFAQNIQLHYDLGRLLHDELSSRTDVTTTVEMFKPDRWGSTYFFVDIDYKGDGVMGAYWEVSREFNLTKNKRFAAHIEYNGGLTSGHAADSYYANRFQHVALLGGAWNWHSADFSKTFSVQAMYRYAFKNGHTGARPFSGFQLTEVWGVNFARGLCTFSGFCDMWYDRGVRGNLIVVSEPQFWFNLGALKGWRGVNLSLGSEVEISNNFVWNERGENDKFYAIPTLAAKWTF
ncbi:DUF5020 domain-containing protein [Prevotella sp. oral taxon 376]|uniref:nucleoside-specific channel-forming Tsx family protein n=1 Tax=Prevotella sp. oral taxon 376 TaxID=712466 RepID=UPI000D1FC04D|nr:DUF5020 family protein [Prevotella sp. oral taxon 376]PTL34341.1 DUF5020 domain-containing protein [Prevotella sp. oral taxon 376]